MDGGELDGVETVVLLHLVVLVSHPHVELAQVGHGAAGLPRHNLEDKDNSVAATFRPTFFWWAVFSTSENLTLRNAFAFLITMLPTFLKGEAFFTAAGFVLEVTDRGLAGVAGVFSTIFLAAFLIPVLAMGIFLTPALEVFLEFGGIAMVLTSDRFDGQRNTVTSKKSLRLICSNVFLLACFIIFIANC